ncbi:Hypp7645 [Branchiostoma lanceolatum]|uniref:Hypp7645 protein n=1 Tax=Branchiostoma lanceolatum TaxID=7740 RepID=A0A8J9Z2Q4_BRALA|nr:Hypp7645 [Branchiostoma lanceolatum]
MKFGVKCGVHLLVVLFHLAVAQEIQYVFVTQVGGSYYRNHTFPLSGSPYIATHEIIVGEDATLTIEAGVEILFDEGVGMTVVGQLQAVACRHLGFVTGRVDYQHGDGKGRITMSDLSCSGTRKICTSVTTEKREQLQTVVSTCSL